jgi:hypothetical protein
MYEFGIINTNCWQETQNTPKIRSFIHTDDPRIIHIIPSGWEAPQRYSVIVEDGELGYPYLQFLDQEQIKTKYNITL